jgi:hypothetical protein
MSWLSAIAYALLATLAAAVILVAIALFWPARSGRAPVEVWIFVGRRGCGARDAAAALRVRGRRRPGADDLRHGVSHDARPLGEDR